MGVEMHQRDRTVLAVQGTQIRQRDGVVTTDRHDPPSPIAHHFLHPILDLGARLGDVVRCDGDIPRVHDLDDFQWGNTQFDVVTGPQRARRLPDGQRPEPGAGPVGRTAVERHAEYRDVVVADFVDVGDASERALAGVARHLRRGDGADRPLATVHGRNSRSR